MAYLGGPSLGTPHQSASKRPRKAMNARVPHRLVWDRVAIAAVALACIVPSRSLAQENLIMTRGQRIAPIYEGWMTNPDGTFEMIFGYFTLNAEEIIDVPLGPDNGIGPDGPDYGQPAHFFPGRSRFTFSVTVPADFGEKELVWTITANGKTEYAFATLKPDYIIDELRKIGAEPLPGRDDLRIPFEFTAGVSDGGSSLTMLTVPTTTAAGDHLRPHTNAS